MIKVITDMSGVKETWQLTRPLSSTPPKISNQFLLKWDPTPMPNFSKKLPKYIRIKVYLAEVATFLLHFSLLPFTSQKLLPLLLKTCLHFRNKQFW